MDDKVIERKEIPILPGYTIDKFGNVYHGNKLKKPFQRNGLYNYIRVHDVSGVKNYNIVKLMGISWLGSTMDDVICFRDKDQTNIHVDNLYIGTKGQYMKDNYNFKKKNNMYNDKRLQRSIYRLTEPVYQLNPETNEIINTFTNIEEASKSFDLPIRNLEDCCFNPKKTCFKFKWCFAFDYINRVE